ncbi:MAG: RNase adapter RapZ [Deltaproteobacteria bacterium]|nr:RNase adapter RapZ [Deltaproteobacteria bacterium]
MKLLRIIIISGLSGSGKSTAIKALEDIGFFCVDNLPIVLLPVFAELLTQSAYQINKVAVVVDVRGKEFLEKFFSTVENLKKEGFNIQILFLESSDEVLQTRFNITRRKHPLDTGAGIIEGIEKERRILQFIRERADQIIDTSDYNVHQLKKFIVQTFSVVPETFSMKIDLLSFGYSYGIPHLADLVIDVRCLPNPYFISDLRRLTGKDEKVIRYLLDKEVVQVFLTRWEEMIKFLIPLYEKEGKAYLTLAIGCTGGQHRSVVVADILAERLKKKYKNVSIFHRDLEREKNQW